MKTNLVFLNANDKSRSSCADHFDIEISNEALNWKGILLEKGRSEYFRTENVMTRDFFFAMELEESFSWNASKENNSQSVFTAPGNIWITSPMNPFSHNNEHKAGFLVLTIEEKILFDNYEGFLPKEQLTFLENYNIQDEVISNLMKLLLLEVQVNGNNGEQYLNHLMKVFSNYFINNYSNLDSIKQNKSSVSSFSEKKLEIVNGYIKKNLDTTIFIEELASLFEMNKFSFLNEFKRFTGITPYQHILTIKMESAKKLLTSTKLNLLEIAIKLGFSDNSHFTKTFKKYYHQTPYQFRISHE